jgi:hypothetical protein
VGGEEFVVLLGWDDSGSNAAAHPDLARSLLRYAGHWDPLD